MFENIITNFTAKATIEVCIINNKEYTDYLFTYLDYPSEFEHLSDFLAEEVPDIVEEIVPSLYKVTQGEYKYTIDLELYCKETKDYFGEIDTDVTYKHAIVKKEPCDFAKECVIKKLNILTLRQLLNQIEMDYVYKDGMFYLKDLTGANLNDIEGERFETVEELIHRLDNYWFDYFFPDKESPDYGKYQTLEDVMYAGYYSDEIYTILHPESIRVEDKVQIIDLEDDFEWV